MTIGLTDPEATLLDGATGTVSIVTDLANAAFAAPSSAVTTAGTRQTAALSAGSATRVPYNRRGRHEWTEITSGLHTGQQVVLADESAPFPSSATALAAATGGTGTTGGADASVGSVAAPVGGVGGGLGGGGGGTGPTNRTGGTI